MAFIVMLWLNRDPEPEQATQSLNPPPIMNTPVPPRINPLPSITYELTRWDLFANHMTLWMRNRVLQIIIVPLFCWYAWNRLANEIRYGSLASILVDGAVVVGTYAGILISAFVGVGLAMSFLLKQRGVVCRHVLEITDEGLLERTDFNQTLHKWPSICRIMNIFGYLFIYVGDQTAHQVPRRDVPPQQMADFEAELRARATAIH
jgi:hypothetical protein